MIAAFAGDKSKRLEDFIPRFGVRAPLSDDAIFQAFEMCRLAEMRTAKS